MLPVARSKSFLLIVLILSVLLVSCRRAEKLQAEATKNYATVFNLEEVRKIVQDKTNRFTAAHITKDTAYLNNIFTEDARVYPPGSEVVEGKPAISKLNADWVNYGIHEFNETSRYFYGNEELLIDEGNYRLRYGMENTEETGKYVNIWKQENGDWKIFSNIWNSSNL